MSVVSAPPTGETVARRRGDVVFQGLARAAALLIMLALAGVAIFLTLEGMPAVTATPEQIGEDNVLLYVWPLLRRMGGADWPEPRRYRLPALFAFPGRKAGRREFWRGILKETPHGLGVDKFARDGSGLISGLRAAHGLIDIPEEVGGVQPGDPVAFIPFAEFGIVGS